MEHLKMKRFLRTLISLAVSTVVTVASAQAEIVDLTSGNGYFDNKHRLVIDTPKNKLTISASFHNPHRVAPHGTNGSRIGQYNRGLGVHRYGDTSHQVDGYGANDILIFDLAKTTTLTEITFSHVDLNDRFEFFLDTDGDGALELVSSGISIVNNAISGLNAGIATVSLANILDATGSLFGIGANGKYDNFKIKGLTFAHDAPPIPVPAALPLMATALFGFGMAHRRRKPIRAV